MKIFIMEQKIMNKDYNEIMFMIHLKNRYALIIE